MKIDLLEYRPHCKVVLHIPTAPMTTSARCFGFNMIGLTVDPELMISLYHLPVGEEVNQEQNSRQKLPFKATSDTIAMSEADVLRKTSFQTTCP